MTAMTVLPDRLTALSVADLAALPTTQLAEIVRNLDDLLTWHKQQRAKVDAALDQSYAERIQKVRADAGKDFGTVEDPHGHGPSRYDAEGNIAEGSTADFGAASVRGIHDGEWSVVGWVTSGGYAHFVEKSMAQCYVPAELAEDESEGLFEIEILGHRCAARINVEPPFDPKGEKMRA